MNSETKNQKIEYAAAASFYVRIKSKAEWFHLSCICCMRRQLNGNEKKSLNILSSHFCRRRVLVVGSYNEWVSSDFWQRINQLINKCSNLIKSVQRIYFSLTNSVVFHFIWFVAIAVAHSTQTTLLISRRHGPLCLCDCPVLWMHRAHPTTCRLFDGLGLPSSSKSIN